MSTIPKPEPAPLSYFDPGDGRRIAYRLRPANAKIKGPTLIFLPGYASDMEGTKANEIDAFAAAAGLACLPPRLFGHRIVGRRLRRRDARPLARRSGVGDRHAGRGAGGADRLVDGRLAGAARGAEAARPGQGAWSASPPRPISPTGASRPNSANRWLKRRGSNARAATAGRPRSPTPASSASATAMRLLDKPILLDCPVRLIHGDKDEEVPVGVAVQAARSTPFRRCPADHHQVGRPPAVEAARDRDHPADDRRACGEDYMILLAALLAAAARRRQPVRAANRASPQKVCVAVARRRKAGTLRRGRRPRSRRRAAMLEAGRPGDRPHARRGRQYVDRRRPAGQGGAGARQGAGRHRPARRPARRGLARPRPRRRGAGRPQDRARQGRRGRRDHQPRTRSSGISRPRWRSARTTRRPPSSPIGRALALEPNDPTVLFEAGHVVQFAGDDAKARDYWTRAAAADPKGKSGDAARRALAMLDVPLTVTNQVTSQPVEEDKDGAMKFLHAMLRVSDPDATIALLQAARARGAPADGQ